MGLRGVLDDLEAVLASRRLHGCHVGGLPVEVDRNDRARAPCDRRGNQGGVDLECVLAAVHQHWARADRRHGERRGHKRVCWKDDLVTGPNADGLEREAQRVEAASHANRMRRSKVLGGVALETFDGIREDELAALEHLVDGGADARFDGLILRGEVHERDGGHHVRRPRPSMTTGRRMLHQSTRWRICVYRSPRGGYAFVTETSRTA